MNGWKDICCCFSEHYLHRLCVKSYTDCYVVCLILSILSTNAQCNIRVIAAAVAQTVTSVAGRHIPASYWCCLQLPCSRSSDPRSLASHLQCSASTAAVTTSLCRHRGQRRWHHWQLSAVDKSHVVVAVCQLTVHWATKLHHCHPKLLPQRNPTHTTSPLCSTKVSTKHHRSLTTAPNLISLEYWCWYLYNLIVYRYFISQILPAKLKRQILQKLHVSAREMYLMISVQ